MTPSAAAATNGSSLSLKENLTLMATHESKLELVKSQAPDLPGPGEALVHVRATGCVLNQGGVVETLNGKLTASSSPCNSQCMRIR